MIVLTERDNKTLDYVADYGGVYVEDIKTVYGDTQYCVRRLKKLMDENFLLRKNKILYLGAKGKQYIKDHGKHYRNIGTDLSLRKRAAEMFSLFNKLQDFTTVPSFKMERITKNFAYRYYGKVINGARKEYWIYRIGKTDLKENDEEDNARKLKGKELEILKIKNEITELRDILGILNVMVFLEDKPGMDIYKDIAGSINIGEHILIPYTKSGLALVNSYVGKGEGDNSLMVQKLNTKGINAKLSHSSWNNADFDIGGTCGINLCTSDYNKEIKLKNYIALTGKIENITITCTAAQEKKYRTEYKGCNIIIIE